MLRAISAMRDALIIFSPCRDTPAIAAIDYAADADAEALMRALILRHAMPRCQRRLPLMIRAVDAAITLIATYARLI